jgi:glycerol-3-phosphate acyltransferase PlsY
MEWMWIAGALVAAYLVGSLSFAVIVSRIFGLADPRSYGSGNPGATNVLRSGHRKAAVFTLVFDALKGFVPVVLCLAFGARVGLTTEIAAWVGLAAFTGHLWPVFFGFKGGKGVATAAGVLLGVHPVLGLAVLATWLLVAYFTRYSSLSALVSAVAAPLIYLALDRGVWYVDGRITLMLVLMGALLIWRHKGNIDKLVRGQESKIGSKKG